MEVDVDESLGIRNEPGWVGAFTRNQAREAFPNGTRVYKVKSKPNDIHQDGSTATVLGSIYVPDLGCLYFVEFDSEPRVAVSIAGFRINR